MFKRENTKIFLLGFITYFVISVILNLLDVDNLITKSIVFTIIVLIFWLFMILSKKNNRS